MAVGHLDELAAELIANGIMREAQQISPGEWHGVIDASRVFNVDETPKPFILEKMDHQKLHTVLVVKFALS